MAVYIFSNSAYIMPTQLYTAYPEGYSAITFFTNLTEITKCLKSRILISQ